MQRAPSRALLLGFIELAIFPIIHISANVKKKIIKKSPNTALGLEL
jgi:hypothetical protein